MIIQTKKISLYLFLIGYTLFLTFSMLGHIETLGGYLNELTNVGILCMLGSLLLSIKSYSVKDLMNIMVLLALSIISILVTNDYAIFKIILFLAPLKYIPIEKCVKFDLYLRIFLIGMVLFLYYLGVAPDNISVSESGIRHSFGFTNPNSFGFHLLIISLSLILLNSSKKLKPKYALILVLTILSDYLTGSRTITLILLSTLILIFVENKYPNFFQLKFIKFLIINCTLIFSILTLFSYNLYINGNEIGEQLNQITSNRLKNIQVYEQEFDLKLFGNDDENMNLTLDSTYAYVFIVLGLGPFVFFIIMSKKLFKKMYENKNATLIIIFFIFYIYGISEKIWFYIDYNVFMMYFAYILFKTKNDNLITDSNLTI